MINRFRGEYSFLSQMSQSRIEFEDGVYQSAEAAFQATKTMDLVERKKFEKMTSTEAKKAGRKLKLRKDWEEVKEQKMYKILKAKFEQNPALLKKLLATGETELVEENYHGDKEWGVYEGVGQNKSGRLLMLVRENLK